MVRFLKKKVLGRSLAIALLVCATSIPVQAAIYEYTDKSGETHYTDRIENIPLEYRESEENVSVFTETKDLTEEEMLTQTEKVKQEALKSIEKKSKSIVVKDVASDLQSEDTHAIANELTLSPSTPTYLPSNTTKKTRPLIKERKGSGY